MEMHYHLGLVALFSSFSSVTTHSSKINIYDMQIHERSFSLFCQKKLHMTTSNKYIYIWGVFKSMFVSLRALTMQDSIIESKTINYILFMVFLLMWQQIFEEKGRKNKTSSLKYRL